MKCTNCGKNNASCHIKYSINGRVTEAHLCHECAGKLEPEPEYAGFTSLLSGFERPFFGGWPFGGGVFAPTLSVLPLLLTRVGVDEEKEDGPKTQESGVDEELSRQRELNELRGRMLAAAEREDYEEAAKLRDELRGLEKKG